VTQALTYTMRLPPLAAANIIGPADSRPRMIRFGEGPEGMVLLVSPDEPVKVLRHDKAVSVVIVERRCP
jgi:hypothetical protein